MKHRTGTLVKRNGKYYVRWVVSGKPFVRILTDKDGQVITRADKAEVAKIEFMAPFRVTDESASLTAIRSKLEVRSNAVAAANDIIHPPLKIADAWVEFDKSPRRPDCCAGSLAGYEAHWNRFVDWMEQRVKGAALRDVDAATAEEYAADLASAKLSPNTYNKHLAALALIFRLLGRTPAYKVTGNPWGRDEIQRKRLTTHSHRELTVEELRKVCAAATGELSMLFTIGVYTGLRLVDAVTLQWGDVDLKRGLIQCVPRKTARRSGKTIQIPLHRTLAAMFAAIREEDRRGPVLPEFCAKYEAGRDRVTKVIQEHFRTCGIATAGPSNSAHPAVSVGFHSLRHTFVSLCREAGAPLSVVESIVGHSSPAMTRHYTHTGEAAARSAIAMLPGLQAEVRGQKSEVRRAPEERRVRLLAKVRRMPAAQVKRAVLRLLVVARVPAGAA